ncbi:MAG: M48 family metalloprotease [Planctomycetota bacterium]
MKRLPGFAIFVLVCVLGCQVMDVILDNAGRNAGMSNQQIALTKGAVKTTAAAMPIGEDEERAYGGAMAVMIVDRYGGLVEDPALVDYVSRVGRTVSSFSGRPGLKYHFAILASDELSALSAPGGYVFVTRGLVKAMKDESQLAAVLAHEVGHIALKHSVKIIHNTKVAGEAGRAAVDVATANKPDAWKNAGVFQKFMDKFIEDFFSKGLPKNCEFEADEAGMTVAARVGYRPDSLRDVLASLKTGKPGAGNWYSSTHPDMAERIRRLEARTAKMSPGGQTLEARYRQNVRIQ